MKHFWSLFIAILFTSSTVFAGVYLKYYNKDSKTYKWKVKTCGSTKEVEFGSGRSAATTIQTGCGDAIIYTDCGEIKVKDGDKITIKNGCIKID